MMKVLSYGGGSRPITRACLATGRCMARMFGGRGRFRMAERIAGLSALKGSSVIVSVGDGGRLEVPLWDSYWTAAIIDRLPYEAEIERILREVAGHGAPWSFIDGGANIGYWTIVAATYMGSHPSVVAVEPSLVTFDRLSANVRLSGLSVPLLRAALWNQSNEDLVLSKGRGHQSASVVGMQGGLESVCSLKLDDVMSRSGVLLEENVVLKLDVEGAETFALEGARQLLGERDVLVVYEDHGKDASGAPTRYLLDVVGYEIYFWDSDVRPRQIRSVSELATIKQNVYKGYNLFACGKDSWFSQFFQA